MANHPAALLGLEIRQGDVLNILIEGEDEKEAVQKIIDFFCE
jgi:phosphotransferase system HPr-like phosphotransfer protein